MVSDKLLWAFMCAQPQNMTISINVMHTAFISSSEVKNLLFHIAKFYDLNLSNW